MKPEKYLDGYNTIAVYDSDRNFHVIKYYADEWYSGDRSKLFAVRTGCEDIMDFRTLNEARSFFRHCADTFARCDAESRAHETIDEILKTWKGTGK